MADAPGSTPAPIPEEGLSALTELAMDLRWSWNHGADELWRRLDPSLWDKTHHPNVVLQTVGRNTLMEALSNADFCALLDRLVQSRRSAAQTPAWFQHMHGGGPLNCVAYFCMEFMLTEALPIYSGGLGNVAGDQLKAASDLGVPVVAVGLLFQRGYFRQVIDRDGVQRATYPYNDPAQLPITPVRRPNGDVLRLELALPGHVIWLRAWHVQVGRLELYLLDTNDAANVAIHRGITGELYGGDAELRLKQELVLGLGGWRLLQELGLQPDVCHLNEGHAAFALLERARAFMVQTGQPFEVALLATRAGNLFTTHTAVAAGFDRFSPSVIEEYLGRYAREALGLSLHELLALGRKDPSDASEPFNMAYLALRGSRATNGVSRLHGEVSRKLFAPLFPRWPLSEVPITHVTNGVHMPTWDSAAADGLWTGSCGKDRWLGASTTLEANIRAVTEEQLWAMRSVSHSVLLEFVRDRLGQQMAAVGAPPSAIAQTQAMLNPGALTLGFARRFAAYKRPNLLLHDPDRLLAILQNPERPALLLLAGKAHPADSVGQSLITDWTRFIRDRHPAPPVVFLADYDMRLAEVLVQGIDVWLNMPRRPWEACGTSGMKALVNGGLNLSELDGWWAEAYCPDVGWALGDGQEHPDGTSDAAEAEALYDRLEHEVIPEFYARDERGIPVAWVKRLRESMARLTPRYSASRSVREYTEQHYLPAALAYRSRARDNGLVARDLERRRAALMLQLQRVEVGELRVRTSCAEHHFTLDVFPNGADPTAVVAELFANALPGQHDERHVMTRSDDSGADSRRLQYAVSVSSTRDISDYTARLLPHCGDLDVPQELPWIRWRD